MASRESWNHLYSMPWANLKTVSQCISLEKKRGDSECKLIIADLNIDEGTSNILAYSAKFVVSSIKIADLVSGVLHFQIGPDDISYPAIAICAGSKIYIYKNLKPFYCYNLPDLAPNEEESTIWRNLLESADVLDATEELKKLISKGVRLTSTSRIFLRCNVHERFQFIETMTPLRPLRYQSVICCISSVKKKNLNADEVDHLIVGTEDCMIYIIETTSFKVIKEIRIEDIPVFISSHGSINMLCDIFVSTRLSYVYLIETNNFKVTTLISFSVPIAGLFSTVEGTVVASQDRLIQMFNSSGAKIWGQKMPAEFVTFRGIYPNMNTEWLLVVVLRNKQIRLYNKKILYSVLNLDYQLQAVTFGSYGSFNNVLVGISEGGGLEIFLTSEKTLRNCVTYDASSRRKHKEISKLSEISKVSEEGRRETENYIDMHKVFNYDYTFMRLKIIKEFISASSTSYLPVAEFEKMQVKVAGEFEGIGPTFLLNLEVKNVGSEVELINLFIVSEFEESNYQLHPNIISVPMIAPGLSYRAHVTVYCLEEVLLIHKSESTPLIVLDFEVPPNESIDI